MRDSHNIGDQVIVFDVPYNRARAESGEPGIPARPAIIEQDVTPHGSRWDPFGDPARRGGAYVDSGPEGDAVYQVRFVEDGLTASVSVHQLMVASEVAAAIHRRAAASESAAQAASAEAARHQAEADRLHAAANAVHPAAAEQ